MLKSLDNSESISYNKIIIKARQGRSFLWTPAREKQK